MADNVTLNAGSGGDVIATEDISGVEYQKVKIADGTAASTAMMGVFSEDAATPATITGPTFMMERDDALSTLTPIEGDWAAPRCDSQGALWVNAVNAGGTSNVDTAAGSTDEGAIMLAIRDDALTTLTPVDGDYVGVRTDSVGAVWTRDRLVTPNGDSMVDDTNDALQVNVVAGSTAGTEYTEDAAAPANPAGPTSMMQRDDALGGLTPIEGDWSHQFCNANGALWVAGDGAFTVSGTVTANLGTANVTNTGTFAVQAAQSGTWTLGANSGVDIGDVTINNASGASAINIQDGGNSITVDNGGTFAVQAAQSGTWNITNVSGTVSLPTGAATAANQSTMITALQLIDNPIVAHDAAATGSTGVNMAGAVATNSVEGRTQVANADATRVVADLNGCLVTRPHTTLEEIISERVSDTGGTSTAFTNFAAGGAGIHNYVTTISIFNSSATDGYVDFRDGTGGAIIFTAPAPAAGGSVINFPVPLKGAANTALAYDVSGALSTVYISVIGFQAQG